MSKAFEILSEGIKSVIENPEKCVTRKREIKKEVEEGYFPNTTFICLEGLDCSGKETIANILKEKLQASCPDASVLIVSLPNYTANDMVTNILKHKLRPLYQYNNYNTNMKNTNLMIEFFMQNILNQMSILNKVINDTYKETNKTRTFVILDRYWFSNLWYQAHDESCLTKATQLADFYNLPKVDYTFILKYPLAITKHLLAQKKNKDVYEMDTSYIEQVYQNMINYKEYIETIIRDHTKNLHDIWVDCAYEDYVKEGDNSELIHIEKIYTPKSIADIILNNIMIGFMSKGEE